MSKTPSPPPRWRPSVAELIADVSRHGARVGVGGFHFTRVPVAQLLELRREHRALTYVAWGGGLGLELLLDARAVARAELTFSSLDVFGLAPRFRRAVEQGELELEEWTALGQITALQATSHGLGLGVMQPLRGTDLGASWSRSLGDACGGAATVAAVPARRLDAFLLHAARADDAGNVELRGARGIDLSALFAADRVLVTVDERVRDGQLGAPGAVIVPRTFVTGVVEAPFGAYPTSSLPAHPADYRRLRAIAATPVDAPLGDELLTPDAERAGALRTAAAADPRALRIALERAPAAPAPPAATRDEVLVCALARTVRDGDVATVGSASPLPTVAYMLAKLLWAPDVTIMSFNGGLVDVGWRPVALSLAEQLDFASSVVHAGGDETYHWYYQQGRVTHEVVGAAQIDRTGATNNIMVLRADGSAVRLPGQGGMADVANLHAGFLLYLPRQSTRNLVERVSVRSAARTVGGVTAVLTDLGRFALDPDAGELVLTHVHPGVTLDEVRERTGWTPRIAADLGETEPPTAQELDALRERVDPLGVRRLDFVAAAERGPLIDELLEREERVLAAATAAAPDVEVAA